MPTALSSIIGLLQRSPTVTSVNIKQWRWLLAYLKGPNSPELFFGLFQWQLLRRKPHLRGGVWGKSPPQNKK